MEKYLVQVNKYEFNLDDPALQKDGEDGTCRIASGLDRFSKSQKEINTKIDKDKKRRRNKYKKTKTKKRGEWNLLHCFGFEQIFNIIRL